MKKLYSLAICSALLTVAQAGSAQEHIVRGNDGERIASTPTSEAQLGTPTMKIRLKGGQTNTLYFEPGGRVQVHIDRTKTVVSGRYAMRGAKVCIDLPVRGTDCWPYAADTAQGSVASITSDRGQRITVTYLQSPALLADAARAGEVATAALDSPVR